MPSSPAHSSCSIFSYMSKLKSKWPVTQGDATANHSNLIFVEHPGVKLVVGEGQFSMQHPKDGVNNWKRKTMSPSLRLSRKHPPTLDTDLRRGAKCSTTPMSLDVQVLCTAAPSSLTSSQRQPHPRWVSSTSDDNFLSLGQALPSTV